MAEKEMVGVRLPADTLRRVEQYADQHDLSKSDALRRMIEKGIDLQEAGLTVAASDQSPESEGEKEAIADGGFLRLSDHPWIDPVIRIGDYSALFAAILTLTASLSAFIAVPLIQSMGKTGLFLWVGAFYALTILGTVMLIVSIAGILVLEYLMHPSEAPIRRYFYDHNDEKAEVISS